MTAAPAHPPIGPPIGALPDSPALSRALALALAGRVGLEAQPLVRASAGTTLLHAGDTLTRLAFLVDGRINAVLRGHGDTAQAVTVTFGAGEIVLLSQLFCDRTSGLDLVAARTSTLRWVPIDRIEHALRQDADALLLLVRFLAQRLREVQVRERAWVERGVHERVCAALVRLAAEHAPQAGERCRITTTHEEFAARCGVSRPKASLALKRLEQAGHIRLHRGAIEVVDLTGLP